jgi:hypothetical protein
LKVINNLCNQLLGKRRLSLLLVFEKDQSHPSFVNKVPGVKAALASC